MSENETNTKSKAMAITVKKTTKREMNKGHLSLNSNDNPEIKDWAVGEEYEVTIKVRQTAIREVDSWEQEEYGVSRGTQKAEFDIIKINKTGPAEKKKGVYISG